MNEAKRIPVLDKGYVELVDSMGGDLSVANAARASFAKRSYEFSQADKKLVEFLSREDHSSPFRHAFVSFEIKAPIMVARQWWKYVVGSDHTMDGWNEASRRYVTMEPEFYIPKPNEWRSSPENKKQGSGEPVNGDLGNMTSIMMEETAAVGLARYNEALEHGICAEQARGFLPAYFMYTNWWWSTSLQGVLHFLNQRLEEDAQVEIQSYAKAIYELVVPLFPVSTAGLVEKHNKE